MKASAVFLLVLMFSPFLLADAKKDFAVSLKEVKGHLVKVSDKVESVFKAYDVYVADLNAKGACSVSKDFFSRHYPNDEVKRDLAKVHLILDKLDMISKNLSPSELGEFKEEMSKVTKLFVDAQMAPQRFAKKEKDCRLNKVMFSKEWLAEKTNPLEPPLASEKASEKASPASE